MAYTQTQLEALQAALASSALKVDFPDGSSVTYRSTDDLRKAIADVQAGLAVQGGARKRQVRVFTGSGY